jgi:hypothetical protein
MIQKFNAHHDFPCDYDVTGYKFKLFNHKIVVGKFKNAEKVKEKQRLFYRNVWMGTFRICIYPFAIEIEL